MSTSFLFKLPIHCIHSTIEPFDGHSPNKPAWTRGGDLETEFCRVNTGLYGSNNHSLYSIDHRSFQIAVYPVAGSAASDSLQNRQQTETSKARQHGVDSGIAEIHDAPSQG